MTSTEERYDYGRQLFDLGWSYELGRWVHPSIQGQFTLEQALELANLVEW